VRFCERCASFERPGSGFDDFAGLLAERLSHDRRSHRRVKSKQSRQDARRNQVLASRGARRKRTDRIVVDWQLGCLNFGYVSVWWMQERSVIVESARLVDDSNPIEGNDDFGSVTGTTDLPAG